MGKVTFNNQNDLFYKSVKKAVDQYFVSNNLKKTGNWALFSKVVILFPMAIAVYLFLLFGSYSNLQGIGISIFFGIVLSAIAFNVMHDACHGSFSSRKWVNETMGLTMNALGSVAYFWKIKHNILHHTYTNVDGIDEDIAKNPLLRMCPTQKWYAPHKFQFLYVFLLYPITTFAWLMIFDFVRYFSYKGNAYANSKIPFKERVIFWVTKILYILFYLVIPVICVGWQAALAGFMIMHFVMGFILAIVFMLAHVVEKTSFEIAGEESKMLESQWAVHQVMTTANFAPTNKVVNWFVGGLNFQVEHHLFPRISHIHYPQISKIVQEQCEMFNLPYHSYPSMTQAVISHFRLMKNLGRKEFPDDVIYSTTALPA
ncbi:MAG TPA: acyl-CoA desaturase [Segetibacter sp.]|jgi:linoleoyl-CoA desaturase